MSESKGTVRVGVDCNEAENKWCAYSYNLVNGKENIINITSYIFDTKELAQTYMENIAYKRNNH